MLQNIRICSFMSLQSLSVCSSIKSLRRSLVEPAKMSKMNRIFIFFAGSFFRWQLSWTNSFFFFFTVSPHSCSTIIICNFCVIWWLHAVSWELKPKCISLLYTFFKYNINLMDWFTHPLDDFWVDVLIK